ncbi:putative leucine-rich repeat domain superfamily [Helianthus debilis subsp. tardiflorus]
MSFIPEQYETYHKFEPFKRARSLRTLLAVSMDQNQRRLTKLPKSFSKLRKLQHFDFRGTSYLIKLPLGIGELTSLQTLTKIVIGGDGGFAITKLKGLNNLGGELSIEGLCKVQSAVDAHEAKLSLKKLTKLELNWRDVSQHETPEKEVLEELKPDSEWLKELAVKSYGGIEFPNGLGILLFISWLMCR